MFFGSFVLLFTCSLVHLFFSSLVLLFTCSLASLFFSLLVFLFTFSSVRLFFCLFGPLLSGSFLHFFFCAHVLNSLFVFFFSFGVFNFQSWNLYESDLRNYAAETLKEIKHQKRSGRRFLPHCFSDICLKGAVINRTCYSTNVTWYNVNSPFKLKGLSTLWSFCILFHLINLLRSHSVKLLNYNKGYYDYITFIFTSDPLTIILQK